MQSLGRFLLLIQEASSNWKTLHSPVALSVKSLESKVHQKVGFSKEIQLFRLTSRSTEYPLWPKNVSDCTSYLCSERFPGCDLLGLFSNCSCLHPGGEIFGGVLGGFCCFGLYINHADSCCFHHPFFTSTCRNKGKARNVSSLKSSA